MNKFEQLIEYVINDEQDKASELFHEIVVEKSRDIYENIMAEEEALDEEVEEVSEEEAVEESIEEELGGSEAGDLIDDIETEEEGISLEAEEEDGDMIDDADEGEQDLEDRVVDVEDKLDELMAEFEELMGDLDADGDGDHDMEDHEAEPEMDGEEEAEEMEMMDSVYEGEALEEGADLTAAPKPVTSEEGDGKSGPVAANSGAKGMDAKPVHTDTTDEKGRTAPSAKDQGGTTKPDLKPAPKPVTK